MSFGMRIGLRGSPLRGLVGALVTLTLVPLGQAQQSNHARKETLVIGELAGRVDLRELTVPTRLGVFPVLGAGNGKPFQVINHTPRRLEVEFTRPGLLDTRNPRRLTFRFYENERALISALILDEVDFAVLENEASALEVAQSNRHFLPLPVLMPKNHVKLVCYNHRKPFLRSRAVRRALSYAIDHRAIIARFLGGKANLAVGPFDNDSPLYNSGMDDYRHDPRKALRLLAAEGWRDSDGDGILDRDGRRLSLQLLYLKGVILDAAIARQIKINLLEIGIDVQPRPLTRREINARLAAGDFDAVLMDYTFSEDIESLAEFFSAAGPHNYMGYQSTTFERYLRFFNEARDPDQKVTLVKSMQRVINQDQPVTFLYFKWWTHYLINTRRLANYRDVEDNKGRIRPFDEWILLDDRGRQ